MRLGYSSTLVINSSIVTPETSDAAQRFRETRMWYQLILKAISMIPCSHATQSDAEAAAVQNPEKWFFSN